MIPHIITSRIHPGQEEAFWILDFAPWHNLGKSLHFARKMKFEICFVVLHFVLVYCDNGNGEGKKRSMANKTTEVRPMIPDSLQPKKNGVPSTQLKHGKMKETQSKVGKRRSGKAHKSGRNAKKAVLTGLNKFALNFHMTLPKAGSLFYSPYSIASVLALVYTGAGGRTKKEIAKALGWDEASEHIVHSSLGEFLAETSKAKHKLKVANKIWIDNYFLIAQNYKKAIQYYYGSKIGKLNSYSEPEISRKVINDWVKSKTAGKIAELIPLGGITQDTRLVLTSAIHFKAMWENQFDPKLTKEKDFTTASNERIKLNMMHGTFDVTMKYSDALIGVELPYRGRKFSMLILLPKNTDLGAVEHSLSPSVLAKMQAFKTSAEIIIPRFKLETDYNIMGNLKLLNIKSMFGSGADFSAMLREQNSEPLFVTDAVQKSYVQVNERGTEAASATATFVGRTINPVFEANKPFLFFIRDTKTDVILFAGRFSPSKSNLD